MSIISISYLQKELPIDASNMDQLITKSVTRGTSYINTWCGKIHYPFSDYDTTTGEPTAPNEIVYYCTEVSKAFYFSAIGEVSRAGEEKSFWLSHLKILRTELQQLKISPQWYTKIISLDANNIMSLGGDASNHAVFQVVPHNSEIIGGSQKWTRRQDWQVVQGKYLNIVTEDYHSDSWYLQVSSNAVDGTFHYMRTFRKDGGDYATYSRMAQ